MTKYDCVIWDWNGTILDDVSASLRCVNDMLKKRSLRQIGIEEYRSYICTPITGFYDNVLDMSRENIDSVLKEYNSGYLKYLETDCGLTKGITQTLSQIRAAGICQAIISSCEKNQLISNAEKYGVTEYFDAILGSDDFYADSKVGRAGSFIRIKFGKKNVRILVVGDTVSDSMLAKALNADCLLVKNGHEDRAKLYETGFPLIPDGSYVGEYIQIQ
ncbi:MAG: HAD hydrolase-like protein [Clostridiales bacterium]|nr:HAD hydrolase-like protein [Clostridiales bacterium]